MATKRIYDLTNATTLNALDKLPVDRSGGTARSILATDFATAVRPYASTLEAQTGTATDRSMTPANATSHFENRTTAYTRTLLDDADAATARTTLGLVAVASSGSASDLGTGTLPIARVADGAVTNAKLANMAQATIKGRASGAGTGVPTDLTGAQVLAIPAFQRPSIASPALRTTLSKMSDVANIQDWDAVDLTGANDEASIVQAAINETSGLTNPVPIVFPGCKIALGSAITVKNGTIFQGTMKAGGSYDTKPTWFHITHSGVGFTNENNTGAQRFTGIGTYRTQPTPGGGAFTPNANDFDFDFVGAQDIVMEDICLLNPTKGIQIRGRTSGAVTSGRITLNRITGQPLQEGIRATHCLDKVYWDEIDFWPFWSSNANVITYTRANGSAYILGRMDNPKFGRLFSWGYQRGMIINNQGADGSLPTGTVGLMYCGVLGMDNCGVAFLVNTGADGATGTFGSLYGASDPSNPSISTESLVWCLADDTRFKIDDLYGQYTNAALLALDGADNAWRIDSSRSKFIDNDAGGTPEFSVGSGNTLSFAHEPETSATTVFGGSGTIITPSKYIKTASTTSTWKNDDASHTASIASGANFTLPTGSGLISVSNHSNGDSALYNVGGGAVDLISTTQSSFVAPTTTPAAGKVSIQYDGSASYRIYSNFGSTATYGISLLTRTRASN